MKNYRKILLFGLAPIMLLGACGPSGMRIYTFGVTEKFDNDLTIKTSWNESEENFIIEYVKTSNHVDCFSFKMSTTNAEIIDDFKTDGIVITFDNGDKIPFNEKGEYEFDTNKTFLVSYKNFNERSKEILLNYSIDFTFNFKTWIFNAKEYGK